MSQAQAEDLDCVVKHHKPTCGRSTVRPEGCTRMKVRQQKNGLATIRSRVRHPASFIFRNNATPFSVAQHVPRQRLPASTCVLHLGLPFRVRQRRARLSAQLCSVRTPISLPLSPQDPGEFLFAPLKHPLKHPWLTAYNFLFVLL